jgi:hypothetical protein
VGMVPGGYQKGGGISQTAGFIMVSGK